MKIDRKKVLKTIFVVGCIYILTMPIHKEAYYWIMTKNVFDEINYDECATRFSINI